MLLPLDSTPAPAVFVAALKVLVQYGTEMDFRRPNASPADRIIADQQQHTNSPPGQIVIRGNDIRDHQELGISQVQFGSLQLFPARCCGKCQLIAGSTRWFHLVAIAHGTSFHP